MDYITCAYINTEQKPSKVIVRGINAFRDRSAGSNTGSTVIELTTEKIYPHPDADGGAKIQVWSVESFQEQSSDVYDAVVLFESARNNLLRVFKEGFPELDNMEIRIK